jgi:hypothetical protein
MALGSVLRVLLGLVGMVALGVLVDLLSRYILRRMETWRERAAAWRKAMNKDARNRVDALATNAVLREEANHLLEMFRFGALGSFILAVALEVALIEVVHSTLHGAMMRYAAMVCVMVAILFGLTMSVAEFRLRRLVLAATLLRLERQEATHTPIADGSRAREPAEDL